MMSPPVNGSIRSSVSHVAVSQKRGIVYGLLKESELLVDGALKLDRDYQYHPQASI